jgi:two-component system, OmpR family, heavy metal sensor histidine kinase CusS
MPVRLALALPQASHEHVDLQDGRLFDVLVMPSAANAGTLALPHLSADDQLRVRNATAVIRLAASAAFLAIALAWSLVRGVGVFALACPLLVYVAMAAAALGFHKRERVRRLFWVMPFLDLGACFTLLQQGILIDTAHAPAWGVTSLGVYTVVVLLAGLSLSGRLVVLHTALSAVAVSALLTKAGLSIWQPLIGTLTLAIVAVSTSFVPRMAEMLRHQGEQTAHALASLGQAQAHNQELERLERERDALLEIIVHDMRSPVGAAVLSLEYLAMELKKHPSQAYLLESAEDALGTMNTLSGMISQILDVSKLESGRLTLRLEYTELRPMLEAAVAKAMAQARAHQLTLDFEAPPGLRAALDQRLFPRALDVLITYCLRLAREGGRVRLVAARVGGASTDDAGIQVSIHSTGPTIQREDRQKVFEKLPVLDREQRRIATWSSGLYFCRLVASAHQATLGIEDAEGWPLSFVMRLPE